ncbi:CvpA family protein [Feifania hominis]|uniref:CvpA family protein n=1 Tax=Feifania hominis TaxID=2763660 RepID=A0A926HU11_9FIRM|nr:CvpA family protein [Feifania hominis]MBC8535460.1 CvpA family protein [Feifania hominis]
MTAILDLATVGIVCLSLVLCYRRGFVRSLANMVGTLISLGIAFFFSGKLGALISRAFIAPIFQNKVDDYLTHLAPAATQGTVGDPVASLFEQMPEVFQNFLNKFSVNAEALKQSVLGAPESEVRQTVVSAVADPMATAVSNLIAFVILFLGSLLLINLLTRALDLVCHLPILHSVNKLLGLALGAVNALLVLFVLCSLLTYFMPFIQNYFGVESGIDSISKTLVFKYIYVMNPFTGLLK